ncbi:Ubiquinone biosynthesis O-methyltransferase, mitochondrial [Sutcliffiella rhizosphaerae]|uniref:Ubiquinone biosynthesis O-methyltransferase, mitochondrial n=1 Tax=Sutcliffiella rhizosphaerae TaxID=2880967 RepID=A0ABM8YRT6_9BACI|nr:Ubiquinone biosynthesis O-methyltransferase, mitochondrial [Sutcliffiella rhizosphaerae]
MKTSIIILTYNQLHLTKQCLKSIIKNTQQKDLEIIVIDNGSSDGTIDYLKSIPHLEIISNGKNLGFAKGCNQGLDIATGDQILFLNNDTIVTKNWLESMKSLLYSDEKIGMVGPVSNYVSGSQQIHVDYTNIDEVQDFASGYCESNAGKSRRVLRLVGFCLLVKKEVMKKIGKFDESFGYGSFEDDDLCLRALNSGYQLRVALDSFVHHHGHATFIGNQDIDIHHLYSINRKKFIDKWKVDLTYFFHSRPEIIELVPLGAKKILDIGCGAGAVGMELLNRQSCKLYGVELNSFIGSIANQHYERVDTIDVETLDLPYTPNSFDTIILADVLEHLKNPWNIIEELSVYLKPSGSLICSIPNISHAEALFPLIQGDWNYVDAGILDRTHLRFFTPKTVQTLFPQDLFEVQSQTYNYVDVDSKVKLFLNEVSYLAKKFDFSLDHLSEYTQIYQILIHAKKH